MGQEQTVSRDPRLHSEVESGYETLVQQNNEGQHEISVLVSGATCAGCIQKIESSLAKEQNIRHVRLNFSTRRLAIAWEGAPDESNGFVHIVRSLGYGVQPFDPKSSQNDTENENRFLLLCLGVAGFSMGNIMLLSVGVWSTSGETMGMATREFLHWVSAIIALPTILFSGRPFFRSALKALKGGHTNMDVPISIALMLAGSMSLYETVNHGEHVYFDSAVMLIFFLLIGRYLDFMARNNARSTATDLLSTLSGFATVVENEQSRQILIRDVKEDMNIRVNTGEKFPVDGIIIDGTSTVDTSLVTGETMPFDIQVKDEVYAGTMNISAPVTIKVARAADDSLLADIVRLMEKATQGQARYVRLADKAAQLYTPIVHSFAALAFLGWWLIGGLVWQEALMISITVLIITCPCALGLAVPVVQVLATSMLMKKNILVKSGDALERLARIDTVLLDKTGTLTLGQPQLDGKNEYLKLAASIAAHSNHPLSKALKYDGDLFHIKDVKEHAGKGLEGVFKGQAIRLGAQRWCGNPNAPSSGKPELWLQIDGKDPHCFYFTDPLRSDTAETISKLKNDGITPIMISGDRLETVNNVAKEAGIDDIHAQQTPIEKSEILHQLKEQGHNIMMVGDGLNDAPVLAAADVSMAPGTAIDMAQNAADIVFMGDKFSPVHHTYKVACHAQSLVKQNFTLAVLYNLIAVPMALCGIVTPLIAALAMSGSSLLVIANSFKLRWLK